jgi:hypothetical protein
MTQIESHAGSEMLTKSRPSYVQGASEPGPQPP